MRKHRRLVICGIRAWLIALALLTCVASGSSVDPNRLNGVARQRYGPAAVEPIADWLRLMDLARDQPLSIKLDRANQFFNLRTVFQDDITAWGQADYWATPLDTLVRGRGDCEDFAIAKYVTLLLLGIPESRLRLIYVKAPVDGRAQAHMVLGYYASPTAEPLILDNLQGTIQPASARHDLYPVFSFNGAGLWAGSVKAPGDPTERLSHWRDLLARLRNEGFR